MNALGVFPAQLRYWRRRRGLSQQELSAISSVSTRHISFLETGRSRPSRGMVLRLATALAMPIREQNRFLRASGHPTRFDDPDADLVSAEVSATLERLISQVLPWPAVVMDRCHTLLSANASGTALLCQLIAEPDAVCSPLNLGLALFDPRLARPFIEDWDALAARMLARLHRVALLYGGDDGLQDLIDELLQFPDVPADWRHPDFSQSTQPLIPFKVRLRDGTRLSFLLTVTMFSDPSRQFAQEVQIETYIPTDAGTEAFVRGLVEG